MAPSRQSTAAASDIGESRANDAPVIVARGLGKLYRVAGEERRHVREYVLGKLYSAGQQEDFWALRNIDLTVERGALLGVVGANGSGKSTLLKLIAGIATPTEGEVHAHGRIAALMELGVGFHPDLTGWENIFLHGSLLGMPRSEIRARLSEIVGFSGLEPHLLEMPVKYYSSGMHARLGFAIAVHSEPDILLIDELLAVGDPQFQARSFERIMRMHREGRAILLVTHNVRAAGEICEEAIWLDKGRVRARGAPAEIVAAHQRDVMSRTIENVLGKGLEAAEQAPAVEVTAARAIAGGSDSSTAERVLRTGAPATLELTLATRRAIEDLQFVALLTRADGWVIAEWDSRSPRTPLRVSRPWRVDGAAVLRFNFEPLLLMGGAFTLALFFYDGEADAKPIASAPRALEFRVAADRYEDRGYLADLPCVWTAR